MVGYSEFIEVTPNLETEKPYMTKGTPIPDTNLVFTERPLPNLTDIRTVAEEDRPTLDGEGFAYIVHKSAAADAFVNKNDEKAYMDEVAVVLKEQLGDVTVYPYQVKVSVAVVFA